MPEVLRFKFKIEVRHWTRLQHKLKSHEIGIVSARRLVCCMLQFLKDTLCCCHADDSDCHANCIEVALITIAKRYRFTTVSIACQFRKITDVRLPTFSLKVPCNTHTLYCDNSTFVDFNFHINIEIFGRWCSNPQKLV